MKTEEDVTISLSSLERFNSLHSTPLTLTGTTTRKNQKLISLYSDLNSDETRLVFGLNTDSILPLDPNNLSAESLSISNGGLRSHNDLSCIRCSKVTPSLFYSSSNAEGSIFLWDLRLDNKKPTQKFSTKTVSVGGESGNSVKPILNFDLSSGDQLLCGGTELVSEDCHLLFWDTRSTQLLGAYWESHSDDITTIKFHPSKIHSLASGSTDGLMNVFDLLQAKEEDALIYSFNTNSSVDTISWKTLKASDKSDSLVCLTHTNDVKIWDSESGDPIQEFSRSTITESLNNSNPDPETVNLRGCFDTNDGKLGILVSASGHNPQLLELSDEDKLLRPKCIFFNQNSVFQTAQYVSKSNEWITCDDSGVVQVWSSKLSDDFANLTVKSSPKKNQTKKKHITARFKPYSKD